MILGGGGSHKCMTPKLVTGADTEGGFGDLKCLS